MRQLKSDHGGESSHDTSKVLGGLDEELRVQEEDTTETKVPPLKLVHYLPHHWDVCVQFYLAWREDIIMPSSSIHWVTVDEAVVFSGHPPSWE